jgi:hypothetical protein
MRRAQACPHVMLHDSPGLPSCCVRAFAAPRSIPPELVINMDQTGMNLVPVGKFTYARKGQRHVRLLGLDDKRQITLVPAITAAGGVLPFQAIVKGTTSRSLPPAADRARTEALGFNYTCSDNHWANKQTMYEWVDNILVPYIAQTMRTLNARLPADHQLPADQKFVFIIDCWKVHLTQASSVHAVSSCAASLNVRRHACGMRAALGAQRNMA